MLNIGAASKYSGCVRLTPRQSLLWVAMPAVYAALGLMAIAARGYEVFPFFCWFLFPVTPNSVERFGLELEVVRGERLEAPLLYERWRAAGARRNSMDLQVAVQQLGNAIEGQRPARVAELRQRIEGNFVDRPCAYAIVRQRYEPLDRWLAGDLGERQVVARYRCGSASGEL